jgi:hypothetical protein
MSKVLSPLLFVVALLLSPAARAEDKAADKAAPPPMMPWEKACEGDWKKLCQAEMKGDVRPCLADHEKELSKECTRHFSAAGFRVAQQCGDDINRLCAEAAVKNQLPQCMQAKQAQLSAKCKHALAAASPPPKPADKPVEEHAVAAKKPRKGKSAK